MTGACIACHKSKVKCPNEDGFPCRRCRRLELECKPHVSRQGQGRSNPKQPRASVTTSNRTTTPVTSPGMTSVNSKHSYKSEGPSRQNARNNNNSSSNNHKTVVKTVSNYANSKETIETQLIQHTKSTSMGPNHFGLHHLIRQWLAFAFTRRSFPLLAKAATLAQQCGISMDDICSGLAPYPNGSKQDMGFLGSMVPIPKHTQVVGGPPLRMDEIPIVLMGATNLTNVGNRLIMIRYLYRGLSRFYVSPQFAQYIADWETISKTWEANEMEVKDIWIPPEEKTRYAQGMIHSIFLKKEPGPEPMFTRMRDTRIRLRQGQYVRTDCYFGYTLLDLDEGYAYLEYAPLEEWPPAGMGPISNQPLPRANPSSHTIEPPPPKRVKTTTTGSSTNNSVASNHSGGLQNPPAPPSPPPPAAAAAAGGSRRSSFVNLMEGLGDDDFMLDNNIYDLEMTAPFEDWLKALNMLPS